MVARVTKALAALALVALAAPVRAVNVDPSADGPFAVGVTTLAFADAARGRSLITELWYPARAAGHDATVRFDLFSAPFFAALSAPAFLLTLIGGTHSGFTDEDSGLAPAALARQQALTRRYATAFLRRYLARDRRFARFLTAEDAVGQGGAVTLTARR